MELLPSMIKSSGYLETRRQLPNQRVFNGIHDEIKDEINYIMIIMMQKRISKLLNSERRYINSECNSERRYINSEYRYINPEYRYINSECRYINSECNS